MKQVWVALSQSLPIGQSPFVMHPVVQRPPTQGIPLQSAGAVLAVDKVSFAGREAFYRVRLDHGPLIQAHVHRPERHLLEQTGARLRLLLPIARLHLFDPVTGRRIEAAS